MAKKKQIKKSKFNDMALAIIMVACLTIGAIYGNYLTAKYRGVEPLPAVSHAKVDCPASSVQEAYTRGFEAGTQHVKR